MIAPRTIRVRFQKEWVAHERRGLLAPDPRVDGLLGRNGKQKGNGNGKQNGSHNGA